jgi:hypothetical protein
MKYHHWYIFRLADEVIDVPRIALRWQVVAVLDIPSFIIIISHIYDDVVLVHDIIALDNRSEFLPSRKRSQNQ